MTIEDAFVAYVQEFADALEALVDIDCRGVAVRKELDAKIEQQDGVELGDLLCRAVILLHENFGGAAVLAGLEAKLAGEFFLVVEKQAVLAAPGEVVQADSGVLQEALEFAQFGGFFGGDQRVPGQVAPVGAKTGCAADPADQLQVTQAAGALLAVGFQRVGRVGVARVALFLFKALRLEELSGVEVAAQAGGETLEQPLVAADEAGFEQVGHHGYVAPGLFDAFIDRTHAVPDLEAHVPDQADHLGQALAEFVIRRAFEQEQQVHIRAGEEFLAPVAADRHQCGRCRQAETLPDFNKYAIHQLRTTLEYGLGQGACFVGGAQRLAAALQAGLVAGDEITG